MATKASKPAKKLGELLQEQQEPFILEIYLSERGCLKKSLSSNGGFNNSHANSSKSLKRSGSVNKTRRGLAHYSKVLQSIRNKLFSINDRLRVKNSDRKNTEVGVFEAGTSRNEEEVAEGDKFSSASSTTVYNSCCSDESDGEEATYSLQKEDRVTVALADAPNCLKNSNFPREEAASDGKLQWRCMEDSKQLSPVSVLEEIPFHGGSPIHKAQQNLSRKQENPTKTSAIFPGKVTEDSILSASLWNILFHSGTEKPSPAGVPEVQEIAKSYSSSQFLKSKRVLLQTQQLLFDYVKDVIATQEKKKKKQQPKELLGCEEIGKLICEKIKVWGKESCATQLVDLGMLASEQECSDLAQQKTEIGIEIADAIFKEIKHEIVIDMFNNLITE